MGKVTGQALLVGSIPLGTVEEVFETCASKLGPGVSAYPDGEIGARRDWIHYLSRQTYLKHPDLESFRSADAREQRPPHTDQEAWEQSFLKFKVRPGVRTLRFESFGYVEAAQRSYEVFDGKRRDGVIPEHARFQVCLPTTGSAIMPFFVDGQDWPLVYDAYREAIRREVAQIATAIPHDDLVIQWDIAGEVRDLVAGDGPMRPWSPRASLEQKWERHLGDMDLLSFDIPDGVALGYHFCFGTWGGWPRTQAPDMSVCVRLANEAVRRAGRRVDYVHMPVMPDADDAFLAPLQQLDVGDTRVYLGIVLHDGVAGFERRAAASHRYVSDFGVAAYCGWGREEPSAVPALLDDLRDSAARLPGILSSSAPS